MSKAIQAIRHYRCSAKEAAAIYEMPFDAIDDEFDIDEEDKHREVARLLNLSRAYVNLPPLDSGQHSLSV
jgi:hypothetical protein